MWNESRLLVLYVKIRDKARRGITLPFLLHIGCLADLTQDYAEVLALLPQNVVQGGMGYLAAQLRCVPEILRSLAGLKVNVKVKDGEQDVRVHVKAL